MDTTSGSRSVWMATTSASNYPALLTDIDADVCVIGAGIAGLTTAYLLSRESKRVVLIEAAGIGSGESGRTTAHFFACLVRSLHAPELRGCLESRGEILGLPLSWLAFRYRRPCPPRPRNHGAGCQQAGTAAGGITQRINAGRRQIEPFLFNDVGCGTPRRPDKAIPFGNHILVATGQMCAVSY